MVTPVAVAPSPNIHAYPATVPSVSPDALPSALQSSPAQEAVNLAVGASLPVEGVRVKESVNVPPEARANDAESVVGVSVTSSDP